MGICHNCRTDIEVTPERTEDIANIIPRSHLTNEIGRIANLIDLENGLDVPEEDPDNDIVSYCLNIHDFTQDSRSFEFEGVVFFEGSESPKKGYVTKSEFIVLEGEIELAKVPAESIHCLKACKNDLGFYLEIAGVSVVVKSEEEWIKWIHEFNSIMGVPVIETSLK